MVLLWRQLSPYTFQGSAAFYQYRDQHATWSNEIRQAREAQRWAHVTEVYRIVVDGECHLVTRCQACESGVWLGKVCMPGARRRRATRESECVGGGQRLNCECEAHGGRRGVEGRPSHGLEDRKNRCRFGEL